MKHVLYILILLPVFLMAPHSSANDSTTSTYFFEDATFDRSHRYNDRTCSDLQSNQCCYQGWKYNRCSFLYDQWEAGLCLKRRNSRKWARCTESPATRDAKAEESSRPPMTYSLSRRTGALPYAADLTACAAYGRRKAGGSGMCAKGVRHALACMARRRGHRVNNMHFHCGGSAYHYKGCLERKGFVNDMSKCNAPGVVRVYRGATQWRSGSGGDYHGHIEFFGTDGLWHAGVSSGLPIDQRLGRSRRQLKACYVLPDGRY